MPRGRDTTRSPARRRDTARGFWLLMLSSVLGMSSCGGDGSPSFDPSRPPRVDTDAPPATRLSEYNLFGYEPGEGFRYNSRVVPYDMNTPLFTDYAVKDRAVFVPEGLEATFEGESLLDLPVGSVLIKSFSMPADARAPESDLTLVETRLLMRSSSGWRAYPYVWNAAGTDAFYSPAGEVRDVPFVDPAGNSRTAQYLIPQQNQCRTCHEVRGDDDRVVVTPIGPRPRNLNRDYDYEGSVGVVNQLEYLASIGMLAGLPDVGGVEAAYDFLGIEAGGVAGLDAAEVDRAARSYLDVNCAHCHNPRGVQGVTSQLFLNVENMDAFRLGVCKLPGSAGAGTGGLTYDIVPGAPDSSILVFRVETEEVGAMMPLIGRSVTHARGAELLRAWVAGMEGDDCPM